MFIASTLGKYNTKNQRRFFQTALQNYYIFLIYANNLTTLLLDTYSSITHNITHHITRNITQLRTQKNYFINTLAISSK